uniref:Uncharacterized protein n=1 Tax=Rhizophora mucronata TaxID=61149 RepID=A0A2P2LKM4_RHIMU
MMQTFFLKLIGGIWTSNCVQMQDFLGHQFDYFGAAGEKWRKVKKSRVRQGHKSISGHVTEDWL